MESEVFGHQNLWRVTWAVDPYSHDGRFQLSPLPWLISLLDEAEAEIEPVCVVQERHVEYWPDLLSINASEICPRVDARIHRLFSALAPSPRCLQPPRVLSQIGNGWEEAVNELVAYALLRTSDFILVAARPSKRGLFSSRHRFTDLLCRVSPLPVMVFDGTTGKLVSGCMGPGFPLDSKDGSGSSDSPLPAYGWFSQHSDRLPAPHSS